MLFKKNEQEYLLNAAGIDAVSAKISECLQKNQYAKDNAIRIRFTMEEILFRLSRHFDEKLNDLGIAPSFTRFSLPFANMLQGETTGIGFMVIIYFLAEYTGTAVTPGWIVTAWIMASIFSMTMPPVSGAYLVCSGMILNQLGMGGAGKAAAAGVISLFVDFFVAAGKLGMTPMELLLDAMHFGTVDHEKPAGRRTKQ